MEPEIETVHTSLLCVGDGSSAAIDRVIYQARETMRPLISFGQDSRHADKHYREGKDFLFAGKDSKYLEKGKLSKFIRDFMSNAKDESLFIVSSNLDRELYKPVLTGWVDLVLDELSCMPLVKTSRLVIALDEVGSLDELRSLPIGIEDANRRGIKMAIAFQNLRGLHKTYGPHMAGYIIDNCRGKLIFKADTYLCAFKLTELLDKSVRAADIVYLPAQTGLLKLGGGVVTQVSFKEDLDFVPKHIDQWTWFTS